MDSSSHAAGLIPHTDDGLLANGSPLTASSPQRYWTESRIEITVSDEQGSRRTVINQPFARIGSHPRSEIVIKGAEAEWRHWYLQVIDEGIFYLDFVASQFQGRLTGGWIDSQKPLKIGQQELTVKLLAPNDCSVAVSPMPSDPISTRLPDLAPKLIGRKKNSIVRFRILNRLTCMGRNTENRIRSNSQGISPVHCVLFRNGSDLWIIDLLTSTGTQLERQKLGAGKVLQPISRLLLGSVKFKLGIPAMIEEVYSSSSNTFQRLTKLLPKESRLEALLGKNGFTAPQQADNSDGADVEIDGLLIAETGAPPAATQTKATEVEPLRDLLSQKETELEQEQKALQRERAELQDFRLRLDTEQDELTQERFQLQRESASLNDLRNSLESQQHDLDRSQAALRAAEEELTLERTRSQAEQAELQQERQTLNERQANLEKLNTQLKGEQSELQDQLNELERKQHEWLAEQQVAQNRLAEERAQFEAKQRELENLLAAATLRQQELDEQCAKLEQSQIQSTDELARFKTEIEELGSERLNLQRELTEREQAWSDSLALADDKTREREQELATVRQEMAAALQAAEQSFLTNQSQWTQERAEWERQRDQALAEVDKWREIVAERDKQLAELSAAADRVSEAASATQTAPEKLAEIAEREAALAEREQAIQELEEKVDATQEQLEKARKALDREALIQHSQLQVLTNLNELRSERSWWHRFQELFRN